MANEDVTCLETLEIRNCSISSDARMNQALTGILQEPPELLETFDIRYVIKISQLYRRNHRKQAECSSLRLLFSHWNFIPTVCDDFTANFLLYPVLYRS